MNGVNGGEKKGMFTGGIASAVTLAVLGDVGWGAG